MYPQKCNGDVTNVNKFENAIQCIFLGSVTCPTQCIIVFSIVVAFVVEVVRLVKYILRFYFGGAAVKVSLIRTIHFIL